MTKYLIIKPVITTLNGASVKLTPQIQIDEKGKEVWATVEFPNDDAHVGTVAKHQKRSTLEKYSRAREEELIATAKARTNGGFQSPGQPNVKLATENAELKAQNEALQAKLDEITANAAKS